MHRINLRSINVRFNTITTVLVLALLAGFGTYNYKATESALNQQLDRALEADDALNQVSEAITTINDMNVQIASAAEEQTAVTDEINQSLTRIVEIAEQAAQDTVETERASERLNRLSEELRALVSHFQV